MKINIILEYDNDMGFLDDFNSEIKSMIKREIMRTVFERQDIKNFVEKQTIKVLEELNV